MILQRLRYKGKKKVKQPYFASITRDSNSTDKLEVDGVRSFYPPLSTNAPMGMVLGVLSLKQGL